MAKYYEAKKSIKEIDAMFANGEIFAEEVLELIDLAAAKSSLYRNNKSEKHRIACRKYRHQK